MKLKTLLLISLFALSGCVSAGNAIDQNKVHALHVGQTTIAEVRAAFGAPEKVIQTQGGDTVLEYIHATAHPNGAAFIPIVGLFAGKEIAHKEVLRLTFDKTGVLKDVQTQKSSTIAHPEG